MKLVRFGAAGAEKPGIIDVNGDVRDISNHLPDLCGLALSRKSLNDLATVDIDSLPFAPSGVRLGPCVGRIGKIVGVGLNYSDHAAESGMPVPKEPILFLKAINSLSGPFDPIELPRNSHETDWEVELGIVIGSHTKYVSELEAMDYVAGFCLVNDVSEREFQQRRSGQWDKGKGCDTFAPIGPWMVTKDEVADPQSLSLWLDVNGEPRQRGNTATMIFNVAFLISYISQFMSLHPGDIIITGTPPGVGQGMKPPQFLKAGDVVTLGVEGLGQQCQVVMEAK
jgi:2-keto-4-pentenoate hydratase/2-oxohepta-3-ene-1,7-dioic acid hydratase in catechol pathway